MARRYSDADIRVLAARDPKTLTSYERRLVRGYQAGLSRSQARGHARKKYDEKPVSEVKRLQFQMMPRPKPAPKITKRVLPLAGNGKLVVTYKPELLVSQLERLIRRSEQGKLRRIYFQVWDGREGKFTSIYQGKRSTVHGITVEEFLSRLDAKVQVGQASTVDEAIRQVLSEDSAVGAGNDSVEGEAAPFTFTQIRLYVLPQQSA